MDDVGSNCKEYGSGIENGRILYTNGRDLQTQKIRKNLRIELYLRWNNDLESRGRLSEIIRIMLVSFQILIQVSSYSHRIIPD